MGKLILLLAVFLSIELAYSQGDAPALLKGQGQTSNQVGSFIQVPNNLVTRINSATGLLETGNNNILVNPSFEHSSYLTGWTSSGTGSNAVELVNEIHGLKAVAVTTSAQTIDLSQSSTLYASQFADGVQGLASIRVKTDHTGTCSVCSVQAGTVSTTNCVSVQANNKWGLYKVPMILGATSNGISLACTSGTGTTYVDDAFVGAVDLKADVDQSRIAGESYFAGTTGCAPSRTNTAIGAFGTDADCPGPTIVTSTMGSWQTTDADLIRQTINNLPAGTYKAKFIVAAGSAGADWYALAINDGTTTCEPFVAGNNNANTSSTFRQNIVECTFTYTSSGNRVFELYGSSASSAVQVDGQRSSPRASTKFILEYFGSGSVYTSTNADTDWAACNFSTLAWQGLGTVTSDLRCKRQGSDLLISGRVTTGTVTTSEIRIPLPVWNGAQLTIGSSQAIASTPSVGRALRSNSSSTAHKDNAILATAGNTYLNAAPIQDSGSVNPLTPNTGSNTFLSTETFSIENVRVPISGWTNSNIIIGQFNGLESCANTLECTDTFSAKVSAAGVVSGENVDFISGNASVSSGLFTFTLNSGLKGGGQNLSNALNCTASTDRPNADATVACRNVDTSTSSSLVMRCENTSSGASSASAFHLICQKQGADYIGKTAKAVASDQNIATPGVTKVKACYYAFGGASATLASPTECTSGTCTEVVDTCGTGSAPSRAVQGVYDDITFASGTFANSSYIKCDCNAYDTTTANNRTCQLQFKTGDQTWSSNSSGGAVLNVVSELGGAGQDAYVNIKCEGQAP